MRPHTSGAARNGTVVGVMAAFLAGMAVAILAGNALVARQEAQENRAAAVTRDEAVKAAERARQALDGDDFLKRLNEANRRVAAAVEPSVVHVAMEAAGRRRMASVGAGSGWVYDAKGHVVTNAHVVQRAARLTVHFSGGQSYPAQVVGVDEATDIAVVKVDEAAPLVPARRATGEPPEQGDRVYAFGSPFGFKFSMSEGIVSGLSRDPSQGSEVFSRDAYTNFIQSDAAINPGNSGGPLTDVRGRVVGMNVAIASDGDGVSRGVGFAIPLTTIEPIVDQLIAHGAVSKGFLGVNMPPSDDANDAALKGAGFAGQGVVITGVIIGAPADAAGLRTGDVVTGVNGESVRTVSQFRAMIATRRPGESLGVQIMRGGEATRLSITLADLDAARKHQDEVAEALRRSGITGISVGGGLGIGEVTADSAAAVAGFTKGQSILSVAGKPIKTFDDLIWVLVNEGFHEGKAAEIQVSNRGGREQKLSLRPPAPVKVDGAARDEPGDDGVDQK
ncbi:MAG: trypsin-like peptidase domain-containing protein [Phycisphaerae bacterium]|nr:trypsin-like peptidase domain-containing protein [Phycisphaerae bacterium]